MLNINEIVAQIIIDIRALKFYQDEPFVLTSGALSPVYIDCRKLISFPRERAIAIRCARLLLEQINKADFDVIAGGETAGIAYAAWLAEDLQRPLVYVRKKAKAFGAKSQIEGHLPEGASVLLVEDLMFDGGSKLNFCQALRGAGAQVAHTLVVFDYGNPAAVKQLNENGIHSHALTNWNALLQVAEASAYFSAQQVAIVRDFLADPKHWAAPT